MFGKLFKYEFRSTAKFGFPLLIGGLLLGVMIDAAIVEIFLSLRLPYLTYVATNFLSISGSILLVLGIFAIAALSVITMIMILKRFYDSTMKAEGYLTFTLPVKSTDLIFTKLLNAWLWEIMVAIVIAIDVCGAILTVWIVDPLTFADMWNSIVWMLDDLGLLFSMVIATISVPARVAIVIATVFAVIVSVPSTLMVFFTIITFVSLNVKKYRILVIVLLYYALSMVTGTFSGVFEAILFVVDDPIIPILILEWASVLGASALLVGGFFLTKYLFEKKLNLE